jgi:hypothetical protein
MAEKLKKKEGEISLLKKTIQVNIFKIEQFRFFYQFVDITPTNKRPSSRS